MKKHILKTITAAAILGIVYWAYGCDQCKRIRDPNPNADVKVKVLGADVVYAQRQVFDLKTMQTITVDLKMDIVGPKMGNATDAPRPLIIFFHGNNLTTYYKNSAEYYKYYRQDIHGDMMLKFAQEHNCVVALVDYVTGTLKWEDSALDFKKDGNCKVDGRSVAPLYDAIEEKRGFYFMVRQGKEAVRFLKSKHLDYNFDLNNITLAGYSAGGQIATGIAFMTDPNFRPSYTNAQSDVVYDKNNKYPDLSLIIACLNISYGKSYQKNPTIFSAPRPDLGNLEGAINYSYDSKVKNLVLLNTGITDPVTINQVGPRLFIYGSDQDKTLIPLQKNGTVPCTNNGPMTIFNGIKTKAEGVGYQNGVNLKVIQAPDNEHNYNQTNLTGGYANITEAIWDFID